MLPGLEPPVTDGRTAAPDLPRPVMVRASLVLVVHERADTVGTELAAALDALGSHDEVVVVDRASGDRTVDEVAALDDERIRLVRLIAPRPTGWALGLGLQQAWGRIVAVPATLSDAGAVAGAIESLAASGALAVEVVHATSGPEGEHPTVGILGWRTAMLGRAGYPESDLERPLAAWADHVEQTLVPTAYQRVTVDPATGAWGPDWHDATTSRRQHLGVTAPLRGRTTFPRRRDPVTVTLASMPRRRDQLAQVVRTLLPQADLICVHLNDYPDVPRWLEHPRIRVSRSQDRGDLRDNGKFVFDDLVPDGHHLLADDDIDYPDDHVDRLVAKVEQFDRHAIVGYHGAVLDLPVESYFAGRRERFHFKRALREDIPVHLLGSGTVALHTDTLRLPLDAFPRTGMADIWLAVLAHGHGIPLIAVARPSGLLRPLQDDGPTLYDEFRDDDSAHVDALRSVDVRRREPWAGR